MIRKQIRNIYRKIRYGVRANSESYIRYLKTLGMRIGDRTIIFDPRYTLIDETRPWMIKIGDDVQITYGVTILTHGYDWSVLKGVYGEICGSSGEVSIGNNVFIGMHSTILKGVHIGDNVIIGANFLVNKDIPDNVVVAGNPCKVIMDLSEYYTKRKARQIDEAAGLVRSYREVFKQDPGERELSEFFWLWTGKNDDYSELHESYKQKMKLVGNENIAIEKLKKNESKYYDLKEFLKEIK